MKSTCAKYGFIRTIRFEEKCSFLCVFFYLQRPIYDCLVDGWTRKRRQSILACHPCLVSFHLLYNHVLYMYISTKTWLNKSSKVKYMYTYYVDILYRHNVPMWLLPSGSEGIKNMMVYDKIYHNHRYNYILCSQETCLYSNYVVIMKPTAASRIMQIRFLSLKSLFREFRCIECCWI